MGAPKQKWTPEEEAALKAGVVKHGSGKWRTILKDPEFSRVLYLRSNVDLKVWASLWSFCLDLIVSTLKSIDILRWIMNFQFCVELSISLRSLIDLCSLLIWDRINGEI